MSSMRIVPITLRNARVFCDAHHRHNMGSHAHKFSVGLIKDDLTVGVGIAGRPVSRIQDDGYTLEVLRVCVLPDTSNGNSMIYGALCRAAKALGYKRVITYTLPEESGCSLLASGFCPDGRTRAAVSWDTPSRRRNQPERFPTGSKIRWERMLYGKDD